METIDQILRDQKDFAARLASDAYFADITVLEERKGVTEADVNQALSTLKKRGGKIGACVVVLMASLQPETPDAPGPRSRARVVVQVIEDPIFNLGANGTGKPASTIAARVRTLLHQFGTGWGGVYAFAGEEPVPAEEGRVSKAVAFERPHQDAPEARTSCPLIEGEEAPAVAVARDLSAGGAKVGGRYVYDVGSGHWVKDADMRIQSDGDGGWVFWSVAEGDSYFTGAGPAESPLDVAVWSAGNIGFGPAPTVAAAEVALVTISAQPGAEVRYTLDGTSYPGASAATYAAPFFAERPARVRAVATLADKQPSSIAEELFL